jgi:hypothetical protein
MVVSMNREDIIRMARQSGMAGFDGVVHAMFQLEAFAALVASAEREACADVCISLANRWSQMGAWGSNTEFHQCAEAIRARGQA